MKSYPRFGMEALKVLSKMRKLRKELKAAFIAAIVMGAFVFLWTPYVMINMICSSHFDFVHLTVCQKPPILDHDKEQASLEKSLRF